MKYMLDTNICIYAIKNKSKQIIQNILSKDPNDICISSITYSELMYGVEKSIYKDRNKLALTLFLSPFKILPFDASCAEEYGNIRTELEENGNPIGPMDMLIASHAKKENLIIVTNNTKEFKRVKDLIVEDWTI